MANIQYYDVILKPVITEKSMDLMADKKYTFLVHTEATKAQIKEAVEKMFEGTKVARVNTMNLEGKNRRRGMVVGKTAKTKKAIVQLTDCLLYTSTVELKGKGFDVKVEQGDKVEAGQLLMKINLPFIRKHHPATVMVILEKTDEFKVACTRDKQIRAGGRLLTLERII